MDIGIGLPATIPGVEAGQIFEWARRAERRGFSSLGVIDRIVYGNQEPLTVLAAAAAVTERIKLATTILIAPYRANAALIAKQAATVQHLSGGRLILGMAVGGREDDYEASHVPFSTRGKLFDAMLPEMRRIWAGEAGIGPVVDPPEIIIGGHNPRAIERAAEYGSGWIMGGGAPEHFAQAAAEVRAAWTKAGRPGTPRLMALGYFALGHNAAAHAQSYLSDYYAFLGPYAEQIAAHTPTDEKSVRALVEAFEQAGADELVIFPANPDPGQVDQLADAVLERGGQ